MFWIFSKKGVLELHFQYSKSFDNIDKYYVQGEVEHCFSIRNGNLVVGGTIIGLEQV